MARVYWPFQGGVSSVDPFLLFMFNVSLCYAILSVPCGLTVAFLGVGWGGAKLLALSCVVFSRGICCLPMWCPGLIVSFPDLSLHLYFK